MNSKMKNNHENLKVAGKHYDPSDYKSHSVLSSGLAVTHEQVSDAYVEGTVDAVIDNPEISKEDNKNK
ncbi:uncharacterized protein DUF4025 [Anoxybacillus vitaminiphilus]|uniref:Uncharacterized protein DUF4025 n=1 Tax=Paranoxybacillus vitaminiphilus TaxID=581036 RepID=A0A327YE15_9BACL|nr:YozQ family protein [Anoxybacillus vitaminiphilus]RAK18412.1 uncharacterized protein DUF4025 [Anoxybacillus vitaminiphilus]